MVVVLVVRLRLQPALFLHRFFLDPLQLGHHRQQVAAVTHVRVVAVVAKQLPGFPARQTVDRTAHQPPTLPVSLFFEVQVTKAVGFHCRTVRCW
jgi:hypothetical protein